MTNGNLIVNHKRGRVSVTLPHALDEILSKLAAALHNDSPDEGTAIAALRQLAEANNQLDTAESLRAEYVHMDVHDATVARAEAIETLRDLVAADALTASLSVTAAWDLVTLLLAHISVVEHAQRGGRAAA